MAGHSKWANIKHRKARQDAARGKILGKCSRAIMAAVRTGGPDPDANLSLRYAIDEAKAANMPKDTIERAIKKAAGAGGGGESYESVRYEGYGAGGVAIIVETLTDNRNRTAPDVRALFTKHGGNLGETGCVGYLFNPKGVITLDADQATGEDKLMEIVIEAGAEDASLDEGVWTITTDPADFLEVRQAIEEAGLTIASAELTMIPTNTVPVSGADAGKVFRLLEALEDLDDVQKVYANFDIAEEEWAALQEA